MTACNLLVRGSRRDFTHFETAMCHAGNERLLLFWSAMMRVTSFMLMTGLTAVCAARALIAKALEQSGELVKNRLLRGYAFKFANSFYRVFRCRLVETQALPRTTVF